VSDPPLETGDTFDVVIVGAGVAGAILAKVLSHAKKSVLLLEAGADAGLQPKSYDAYVTAYYAALAKVPNSPYPKNANAPSADVLDIRRAGAGTPGDSGYLVQQGPMPFGSDFLRAAGGTTLHWLGTTLRMLPTDFTLRTLYGHGVDWPIAYDDIRPFYEMAEREIGVAGDVEDQYFPGIAPTFFGRGYQFPMQRIPQSYLDRRCIDRLSNATVRASGRSHRLKIASTPQGRNSIPNGQYVPAGSVSDPLTGQRCEGNASCVPICPVQAKYSALKTLNRMDRRYVRVVTQAVASEIQIDTDTGRVTGIAYKRYHSPGSSEHTIHTAKGRFFAIAGNAIETAKLLLASGASRSSPDLGCNLMDHPTMLTWGLMPGAVGAFRGPGSTSHIASFRDGGFRKTHAGFIMPIDNWGWGWPTFAPGSNVEEALRQNLYGRRLREHLHDTVPRQITLHCEFEQLPERTNRVTIDRQFMDRLGNYRPVIRYDVSDYTRAAMAVGKRVSQQMFKRLGARDFTDHQSSEPNYVTYDGEGYAFRGAGHLIGTHRMGFSPADSVVDRQQRSWDHPNLYLVGAGSMATTGTCNPTLTVAALSFWASDTLVRQLNRP
jgi:choline dehydrogenase-like flavoprotein